MLFLILDAPPHGKRYGTDRDCECGYTEKDFLPILVKNEVALFVVCPPGVDGVNKMVEIFKEFAPVEVKELKSGTSSTSVGRPSSHLEPISTIEICSVSMTKSECIDYPKISTCEMKKTCDEDRYSDFEDEDKNKNCIEKDKLYPDNVEEDVIKECSDTKKFEEMENDMKNEECEKKKCEEKKVSKAKTVHKKSAKESVVMKNSMPSSMSVPMSMPMSMSSSTTASCDSSVAPQNEFCNFVMGKLNKKSTNINLRNKENKRNLI